MFQRLRIYNISQILPFPPIPRKYLEICVYMQINLHPSTVSMHLIINKLTLPNKCAFCININFPSNTVELWVVVIFGVLAVLITPDTFYILFIMVVIGQWYNFIGLFISRIG